MNDSTSSSSNGPDIAGLPARRAALDLLGAALSRRAGMEEATSRPSFSGLAPRDRGFAHALVLATLRHLGPIDRALDAKLAKAPPEAVRNILRLGAAQAFALGTPAFAAVGTSVDLAAAVRETRPFKGLVNAVLRALTREPPNLTDPEALAPPWLFARWQAAFGAEEARAIAAQIASEPATDLTARDPSAAPPAELEVEVLPGGTWRTALRGDVSTWPGYSEGSWWVQDASAAVPARLFDLGPDRTALDLCAAPGGKTLQLAATGAGVVAVDRSAARLVRVAENLARTGLKAETVTADAGDWADERQFDAVLLDAPCSATGTFRRNPDVLWAARPGDVASLSAVQSRLLDSAARRVRPGGRLVYCVCSLEPEEGEAQVAGFLARHGDFTLDPVASGEGGSPPASLRPDGTLRILPHHRPGGTDGFFVARFRRTAD
ncbi:MAG TPA: RsmB/NOP family class I SAM-dependent RNA methyltransferase [Phenylobacterium sp.]|nr:RsmB/NOP family class I SAM-dependent RNA methyltransferase [Phenylobacterium sp.]